MVRESKENPCSQHALMMMMMMINCPHFLNLRLWFILILFISTHKYSLNYFLMKIEYLQTSPNRGFDNMTVLGKKTLAFFLTNIKARIVRDTRKTVFYWRLANCPVTNTKTNAVFKCEGVLKITTRITTKPMHIDIWKS